MCMILMQRSYMWVDWWKERILSLSNSQMNTVNLLLQLLPLPPKVLAWVLEKVLEVSEFLGYLFRRVLGQHKLQHIFGNKEL